MGRVFSLEQVRDAERYIPTPQHFEWAEIDFEQSVREEMERELLVSAVVFGSAALRACTPMSDWDCVLVPRDHSLDSQKALDRIVSATSQDGRIEVNPIAHTKTRLASGNHEIDRFFGEHLAGESRIVFGEDIATYLRFGNTDASTIVTNYIEHKMRSIAHGMMPSDPEYHKGLQRILELPLAIGRKALRALDEVNGASFASSDSANRAIITPAVMRLFETLDLGSTAHTLLDLGYAYKQCLTAVLDGRATEQDYQNILAEIRARGGDASTWLDELDVTLKPLLTQPKTKL